MPTDHREPSGERATPRESSSVGTSALARASFVRMLRSLVRGALVALIATAARGAGASPNESTRVVLRFSAQVSRAEVTRLASAIRAQLGDVATLVDRITSADDRIVEVDRSDAGLVLRLADGAGRTSRSRLVADGGEVGASEAASIVRAFVLATAEASANADAPAAETASALPSARDGETRVPNATDEPAKDTSSGPTPPRVPGPTREPSPPPATRGATHEHDAPTTSTDAGGHARVAALYTGATYAATLPWQSGARLEGAYAFVPSAYVGLTYALHPSATIATESATARVSRQSGAAFVGVEKHRGAWAIGADASFGLEGSSIASSAALTGGGARVAPLFAVRLHGRWRVPGGRGAAVDLAPAFELAPGQEPLTIDANGSSTELALAAARLRLDVGGSFDLF